MPTQSHSHSQPHSHSHSPLPSPSLRPPFNPVDTSVTPSGSLKDDVESPSLSSSNALARFEFEPGRSADGTKILMVEWEDDETTRNTPGEWSVSWEGKRTVLPARDNNNNNASGDDKSSTNRLYFLLPAGERVPATVTLTHAPEIGGREGAPEAVVVVWKTNPLPAIFPPELGASARQAGKKGVLHTVWAKKRLQVLQKEIEAESRINAEGVGLLMAIQEKEWIEQNFGVTTKPSGISIPTGQGAMGGVLGSPTSPRSPGGGRLMEKLRGLKLGTSERDLGARKENGTENGLGLSNPLSPEQSDHAVSSFGSFAALKGMPDTSTLGAKPAQPPQQQQQPLRQMAAQRPPESILAQQRQVGTTSLNAFADQHTHTGLAPIHPDEDKEDDLFALPMSPRSPEDSRSPFSFGAEDTMRYLQRIERV